MSDPYAKPSNVDCYCDYCGLEIYKSDNPDKFECDCGRTVCDEDTCRDFCKICDTKACLYCLKKDPDTGEYYCRHNLDCAESMDEKAIKLFRGEK
jgi:hypothetical protein